VHARLELFDFVAEGGCRFQNRRLLLLRRANRVEPRVGVTDMGADLFGAVPESFQISTPRELLVHAPPDFRIQLVEAVQALLYLLDDLALLARPGQRGFERGDGLPRSIRDLIGIAEEAQFLENRLELMLDRRRVAREPRDVRAGRLERRTIGVEPRAEFG